MLYITRVRLQPSFCQSSVPKQYKIFVIHFLVWYNLDLSSAVAMEDLRFFHTSYSVVESAFFQEVFSVRNYLSLS